MEDRDSVFVPKDLSKIKTKFLFGLTRRQCLFFGLGAAVVVTNFRICIFMIYENSYFVNIISFF